MRRWLAACAAATLLWTHSGTVAYAQPAYSGLVVAPALIQLSLGNGQDSASFTTSVTNDSSSSVMIAVAVDDFTSLDTSGTPLFLNNAARLPAPHGLAHWMEPGIAQFTVAAKESKTVPIAITRASTMATGGHYGAVIFSIVPAASGALKNTFTANASVSTLVFLTTDSPGTQALTLSRPSISRFAFEMPSTQDVVFTNTGNTQTTPRGIVTIDERAGEEVARGIINTDSGQILPTTKRLYQVQLGSERRIIWPGMYQMRIQYRHDGQQTSAEFVQSFLYVPTPVVLVSGIVLLIGAGLLLRRLLPSTFVRATRR